jgi:MFS family permease
VGEPASATSTGAGLLVSVLTLAVLLGALAAQWSPAFSSYDSDLWTHVLIVERVADGQDLLRDEPFRLEPPPSPHVTPAWLTLGHLRRWSALPPLVLVRALALVVIALLCAGAWTLARRLFGASPVRAIAFFLFWASLPESLSAIVLGRYASFAFVALAAAAAVDVGESRRAAVWSGLFIALAFYAHLFGGVLAAAAVLVVLVARWRCGDPPGWRQPVLAGGIGALVAAPCLAYALATAGLARTSAHTWRPEQVEALGLLWMRPSQILDLLPLGTLVLALVGLAAPCRPERRLAREICRVGTVLAALVLLTPLYQAVVALFGAWMVGRVAMLAFPWLSAALAIEWLRGDGRSSLRRAAENAVLVVIAAQTASRAVKDWTGQAYELTAEARGEATALRGTLRDRTFIAPDLMSYGLAAPTLGRPLAVPPGHASPFGDFRRRQRRVHRAFSANTADCWAALFALYPDVEFLLTPAAGAAVERRIWQERFPEVKPEEVRDRLRSLGVLVPAHEGPTLVLDGLRPGRLGEGRPARTGGMGTGPRCRDDP